MHIVVLTGSFFPELMAPSACIKPYLIELARENQVDVVCPVSDPRFNDEIWVDKIHVYFVTNRLNELCVNANHFSRERRSRIFSKCLSLFVRGLQYFKEVFAPSPYDNSLEDVFLQKLVSINEKNRINFLISVTFPFYTHVFALKFKQTHPEIKWLTYTTDPLAYNEANPIPAWKKRRAVDIEQKVYDGCDCCLITEELHSNLNNDYHISEQKIVVLPYLIETDRVPTLLSGVKQNDRPQVLYAGCLFHRVRNPQLLLDVFSELQDIDLNLYVTGDRKCRKILRDSFPPNISINSVVPREEYFSLLSQADILVNLSNNAKLQAPHKLLELISTGRPIINFYYFKNTSYGIIEKYPLGINISNSLNANEIRLIIRDFVMKNQNKHLSDKEIKDIYPENLLLFQMARIKELLK